MTTKLQNYRFIERGYDYTFRFYPNGTVTIFDNATNSTIRPKELSGAPLDFFAKKKIQFIKNKLIEANRSAAG
ncbi:hypothetical protein FE782_06230 [Paenibacillus antri]|uniref:Uncharacterized protein n=1 Tax=Paenibacillus antri TaxID=2582848 RepID=A0A5R9GF17_9BACL|nr:hypothetical protein [Paenibacillus antri]TLS52966.1 hypothetical protein FE782_06230 [Paenibacillus antri]